MGRKRGNRSKKSAIQAASNVEEVEDEHEDFDDTRTKTHEMSVAAILSEIKSNAAEYIDHSEPEKPASHYSGEQSDVERDARHNGWSDVQPHHHTGPGYANERFQSRSNSYENDAPYEQEMPNHQRNKNGQKFRQREKYHNKSRFQRGISNDSNRSNRNHPRPPIDPSSVPSLFDLDFSEPPLAAAKLNEMQRPPPVKAPPKPGLLPIPDSLESQVTSGPAKRFNHPPPGTHIPPGQSIDDRIAIIANDPLYTDEEKDAMIEEIMRMVPQARQSVNKRPALLKSPDDRLDDTRFDVPSNNATVDTSKPPPEPPRIMSLFSKEEEEEIRARRARERKAKRQESNKGYESDTHSQHGTGEGRVYKKPFNKRRNDGYFNEQEEAQRSNELYQELIVLTPDEEAALEEVAKAQAEVEKESVVPPFLRCPLCSDLIDDPVVLPCFHSICRVKCIPRLVKDEQNVWCPNCKTLQFVKGGVESLNTATTFEKMIEKHKEDVEKKKRLEAEALAKQGGVETSESGADETSTTNPEAQETKITDKVADLTCTFCERLFSLPVKLSCGHAICKFPCAYKSYEFNSKIVCTICEKPSWVDSVQALPVHKEFVRRLQKIKGERYLDEHARDVRALENRLQADQYSGISVLFDDDETFLWRLSLLGQVIKQKESAPSLLNMPFGASLAFKKNNRKKGRKKRQDDEEDDYNPDDFYPSEEPSHSSATFMGAGGDPAMYSQADGQQMAFGQYHDPSQLANQGMYAEVQPVVQQTFQPPILDVKSMVPDNPGPDFDYIAPWNLFAQQTQHYYTTYYASLGGVPPEAQQQVKEYLEKCWSWYSAYFKLQTVKSDKSANTNLPQVESASKDDVDEVATQVKKLKTAKNKKEREKLISDLSTVGAAVSSKDEKAEQLEIEELKILLLKKQLELKLKSAKSKSEARDLKKLKELVEAEENGDILDEEEKKKKEAEEKARKEKELEELREAARKKQEERERQIEELEKKRKRTRQEELRKLEKARKRTQERQEREEGGSDKSGDEGGGESRSRRPRSRSPGDRSESRDRYERSHSRDRGRDDYYGDYSGDYNGGDYRDDYNYSGGRGGYRGRGRAIRSRGRGGYAPSERGGYIPRGRGRGRGRGNPHQQYPPDDYYQQYDAPYLKKSAKPSRYSRSRSRSYSRSESSRSRSRSRSSGGSGGREQPEVRRKRRLVVPPPYYDQPPSKKPMTAAEDKNSQEPKYIKVSNLPDDVTAKSLKGFIEAFGRVITCKIGKMQGELIAIVQMQTISDAISCVREMRGQPFKNKPLDVAYLGNNPMVKQVEVSIPDIHGPRPKKPAATTGANPSTSTASSGGASGSSPRKDQRTLLLLNLPWGTTETEVIDLVSRHTLVLQCRVGSSSDPASRGGLYAEVVLETYFDVLKCINQLHGLPYEGNVLQAKKVTV